LDFRLYFIAAPLLFPTTKFRLNSGAAVRPISLEFHCTAGVSGLDMNPVHGQKVREWAEDH
jgi:hypothetical protein